MHDPETHKAREEILHELEELQKAADESFRIYVEIIERLAAARARAEKLPGEGPPPSGRN